MKPKSRLDILSEQFAHWRSTRGKRSQTPHHLKQAVLEIVGHYSKQEINRALGINSDTVKRWSNELTHTPQDSEFIELKPFNELPSSDPESLELKLQLGELAIAATGPSHELVSFVQQLAGGESS